MIRLLRVLAVMTALTGASAPASAHMSGDCLDDLLVYLLTSDMMGSVKDVDKIRELADKMDRKRLDAIRTCVDEADWRSGKLPSLY